MPAGGSRKDIEFWEKVAREEAERAAREAGEPERKGYMGVTIVGGFIWPTWSQSREMFEVQGYNGG